MDSTPAVIHGGDAANIDHERLTSLIGSMADGVIAVDDSIRIVLYNGAVLNILDINTDMKGKKLHTQLKLYDPAGKAIDCNQLVLHTTTPTASRDYRLQYADGSHANVYLSIAPVRLGYGSQGERGHVLLLRDITHEKSLEEERDEFISVVSHELRTPIAIAEGHIGNAQFLIQKGSSPTDVANALRVAHEQVLFLAGMINDLSMLSRAERGTLTPEITPIDIHALVHDLNETYQPEASAKGLAFLTALDDPLPPLLSSQLYVKEVLQNFITNALKYTQQGSITLHVQARDTGIAFDVTDTGIGLSKSDQKRVFDKFFRSEDYRTRTTNGTGLGLYITQKLAKLLQATITVHSVLNKGSTFSVFVPHSTVSNPPSASSTITNT